MNIRTFVRVLSDLCTTSTGRRAVGANLHQPTARTDIRSAPTRSSCPGSNAPAASGTEPIAAGPATPRSTPRLVGMTAPQGTSTVGSSSREVHVKTGFGGSYVYNPDDFGGNYALATELNEGFNDIGDYWRTLAERTNR